MSLLGRVFSFPAAISALLTVLTFLTVRSRFQDPDTWWHLRVGQVIAETGSIPRTDLFSYTTGQHAWVPHEWLAQAALYQVYRAGGYTGLWAALAATASALLVLLYVLCWKYSGNAKVAFLGALHGWFFATVGLSLRPHLLGYLFLVTELLVLHQARRRSVHWLWTLPPLFAVWVNCHGSYGLGLVVLGVAAACGSLDWEAGRIVSCARPRRERRVYWEATAASAAALLINPVGFKLLAYPIDLFLRQTENLGAVLEWQPLSVGDPRGVGLFLVAGVLGVLFLVRSVRVTLEELTLTTLAFGMALRHSRLSFTFGILVAPILCRLLADLWPSYDPRRDNRVANAALLALSAAALVRAAPPAANLGQQVERRYPTGAVDYIRRAQLPGPMLNDYEWGGYLIWALPEYKVFIDGRADIFDWTGVLTAYKRWMTLEEDPSRLPEQYGIRFCLLPKQRPMTMVLRRLAGWKQVYADDVSVIFVRSDSSEVRGRK